jgi:transcriptional regulator with XRE-family HTH domain
MGSGSAWIADRICCSGVVDKGGPCWTSPGTRWRRTHNWVIGEKVLVRSIIYKVLAEDFGMSPELSVFYRKSTESYRPFNAFNMNTKDSQTVKHEGRNVKRLREILGIKQDALAAELGINQQKMSFIEQKEKIEEEQMAEIAKALKVPVEAIRNFDEEAAINIISNTFSDFKDNASGINYNCSLTFNPIEKLMEALEENKRLYGQLLESEREKVAMLEKMLHKTK